VPALAGKSQEAIAALRIATRACEDLFDIPTHIQAHLYMGMAQENTGDMAGARSAYQQVLDRWGSARPRSTTADEARARLARLPR